MRWKNAPPFVPRPGQPPPVEREPVSAINVRDELEKRRGAARSRKKE